MSNIYKIKDEADQTIQLAWLEVLAVPICENGTTTIDFYGLTHVNNTKQKTLNYGLSNSPYKCQITIQIEKEPSPTILRYSIIPTVKNLGNPPLFYQLNQFCSPSTYTKWNIIEGYGESNILALSLSTLNYTITRSSKHRKIPQTSFSFPSINNEEVILDLRVKATKRHHCIKEPCTEFMICPSTVEPPVPTLPPHGHCLAHNCVNYYEMCTL